MHKFPGSIRVKVQVKGLPDAIQTCLKHKATPELTIDFLNRTARRQGLSTVYTLATEEEYQAYRESIKV